MARRRLQELLKSIDILTRPMPVADLLQAIAERAQGLVSDVETAVAYVPAERQDIFRVMGAAGPWAVRFQGAETRQERALSALRAIVDRRPVETTPTEHPDSAGSEEARQAGFSVIRLVPMVLGDNLPDGRTSLGVLCFFRREPATYSDEERRATDEFSKHAALILHRAELLEVADRTTRRLRVGIDVALSVATTHDVREVIRRLLERTVDAIDADRATMSAVDGEEVVIEGAYDVAGPVAAVGSRWKITAPEFRQMLVDHKPVTSRYDPERLPSPFREQLAEVRHLLTLPLVIAGEVRATLAVSRRRDQPFSFNDLATLQEIGTVAALALRNARLFHEVEMARDDATRLARRLRDAVDIALDLAAELDPAIQIRGLLRRAVESVDADRGTLLRVEGADAVVDDSYARSGAPVPVGSRWAIEDFPILRRALVERLPAQENRGTESFPTSEPMGRVEHVITVPLVIQGETVGAIGLSRLRDPEFGDEEIATAQQIGNAAVVLMRNVRLLKEATDASQVKTNFLNTAAHQLRTPLAVVTGYLSMLQDGSLAGDPGLSRQAVDVLVDKAGELRDLVNGLVAEATAARGGGQ